VGAAARSEPNQATKFGRAKTGHENVQGLVGIRSKLSRCNRLRVVRIGGLVCQSAIEAHAPAFAVLWLMLDFPFVRLLGARCSPSNG
jgi:hypothetical protein